MEGGGRTPWTNRRIFSDGNLHIRRVSGLPGGLRWHGV